MKMARILIAFATLIITACSGGGGGGAGSSSGITHIAGVAAKGAYLAQGSVVQIRARGSSVSSTTISDAQGGFSIDVQGITGPFLIRACDGDCNAGGTWYYSYLGSVPVQSIISTADDVSGSLNNTYFLISSLNSISQAEKDFYVWFNVNSAGVDPAIAGKTGIEIDIPTNSAANDNATALVTALGSLSNDFASATAVGNVVTIVNTNSGDVPSASDGTVATSFVFDSKTTGLANINPYTDLMIRAWYSGVCVVGSGAADINIDDVYVSGMYPNGTSKCVSNAPSSSSGTIADNSLIDLPTPDTIAKVQSLMSNMIANIFNINIENVLVANWVQGEGFDSLLDSVGADNVRFYLLGSNTLSGAVHYPDDLTNFLVYSEVVVSQTGATVNSRTINMHADLWSPQSTVALSDYYGNFTVPLVLQSDSTASSNHYIGNQTITAQTPLVNFEVNGISYTQLTLGVVNYGVGTAMTWNFDGGIPSATLNVAQPWTKGNGVTVTSVGGSSVTIAVSDINPASIVVTNGSGIVLGSNTYTSLSPTWTGSATISLSSVPGSFTVSVIGKDGQRTHVNYN